MEISQLVWRLNNTATIFQYEETLYSLASWEILETLSKISCKKKDFINGSITVIKFIAFFN